MKSDLRLFLAAGLLACRVPAAAPQGPAPAPRPAQPRLESTCRDAAGTTTADSRYPSGQLAMQVGCDGGRPHGRFVAWFPSGSPRVVGAYTAGVRSGRWLEWHHSGHLWLDRSYVDGREHGPWAEFDATGRPRFEGTYAAGRLDGEWKSWCEEGPVAATGRSVAGKLEGIVTIHFCRSPGRYEQAFTANRPQGVWRIFAGDVLSSEVTYKDGLLDGPWRAYDDQGKLTESGAYANGVEVEAPSAGGSP